MGGMEPTKTCKTCQRELPLDNFPAQHDPRRGKTYTRAHCDPCWKAQPHKRREYRQGERARAALRSGRGYRAIGRKGRCRTIRESQVMLCLEAHRAWGQWVRAQKPKMTAAERYQARVKSDPEFRLTQRMRRRLRKALRGKVAEGTLDQLFGYTIAQLRAHLEARFMPGMGWHNMGRWHIDHIVPVISFNQHDQEQFARCWSLDNLQPLWARDNIAKGAKLNGVGQS